MMVIWHKEIIIIALALPPVTFRYLATATVASSLSPCPMMSTKHVHVRYHPDSTQLKIYQPETRSKNHFVSSLFDMIMCAVCAIEDRYSQLLEATVEKILPLDGLTVELKILNTA